MPDIDHIRGEIERMRAQVHRQRGEIRQLQRSGIPTASAEALLDRMLDKIDALCADRDRFKKELPMVSKAKSWAVGAGDARTSQVVRRRRHGYKPSDEGWGRGRRPVINVSWDDAKAYASWLSEKTGKIYRLPTEAEREYVTRASTQTPFCFGTDISTSQANYGGDRRKTVPVDSFKPNPWGLYQVHGNVSEWCEDNWHVNYGGASADGSVRSGGDSSLRVVRGGAWRGPSDSLRSTARVGPFHSNQFDFVGFRVARTL
jgi:formylglycine-generating enzyme required for sulfatase activity